MMATHWSADDPTHLGGYEKLTRMCAATSRPPRPARGPMRDPRTPPFRLRYVHSPAAGDSAAEASTKADEAATADELPALLDGRSDEDAPVKYVRLETQSRGNLHPHGNLYVAHSRVKNVASAHMYVAKYVAKD